MDVCRAGNASCILAETCLKSRIGATVAGQAEGAVVRYQGTDSVGLSEIDRNLLERCLQKKPRAWEDFVDRFMGLVLHVIRHTAQSRSIRLSPEDRDDLCAEVFLGGDSQ